MGGAEAGISPPWYCNIFLFCNQENPVWSPGACAAAWALVPAGKLRYTAPRPPLRQPARGPERPGWRGRRPGQRRRGRPASWSGWGAALCMQW